MNEKNQDLLTFIQFVINAIFTKLFNSWSWSPFSFLHDCISFLRQTENCDYMCELIYLKTWLLCYKNCRVALFLTFLLFPYLILKLLTIVQKVKMSNISFFFFLRFEHFYISLYRTPVQCVSEYKIPFTLYSYDDLYSLQKWPRSSKPFS